MAKSEREIAVEVICGKWGNGDERVVNLVNAGYNPSNIQAIVNQIAHDMVEYEQAEKHYGKEILEYGKEILEIDVDLSKYGALILNFTGV